MAVWKDVPGYEGLYLVSDEGQVMSVDQDVLGKNASGEMIIHRHGKQIKPHERGKDGLMYLAVCLSNGGISKSYSVHRLVAEAFIPNPDNLPEINHKDENTKNNCVENLEWCTRQYNIDYSKSKHVAQYLDGVKIAEYKSIAYAAEIIGISRKSINNVLCGWSKSAGGFNWKYEEE